jgi:hypothetical protein
VIYAKAKRWSLPKFCIVGTCWKTHWNPSEYQFLVVRCLAWECLQLRDLFGRRQQDTMAHPVCIDRRH